MQMDLKDFFDENFDTMHHLPHYFNTEEGKIIRRQLSDFFYRFIAQYEKRVSETNFHYLFYSLNKPFHLLFCIHEEKVYFVFSNDHALRGKCYLYKINEDSYVDTIKLAQYATLCGFGEKTIIMETTKAIFDPIKSDEIIKKEVDELIKYEIEQWERRKEILNVKPFFGDIQFKVNPRKLFMLMPFGSNELNEFYEDHIKRSIEAIGMNCLRADDIFNNKSIIDDIWRNINEARIIVADLTHRNPNVFYEVGIAHTLGKDVILISQDEGDIPFDLRHIRTIFYKNTTRGADIFSDQLQRTIKGILENDKID
jgi:hypothetical protein